jgi:hypothetical protein
MGFATRTLLKRKPAAWPNADARRHYDFKYTTGHRIDVFG